MQEKTLYISPQTELVADTIQYCLYARKSSEAEEKQALSIESQVKEMLAVADRNGLTVAEVYRESHSAKDCGQRPVYNQLLTNIRSGKFSGILVWHPDRLSRNAGDLGALVDLLDQKKLVEIRTFSQRFTNNPNEKFLLMILGSQAKLENDNKSVNVKRGMRARVEMGLWPATAPTGYLNEKRIDHKCEVNIDPDRAGVIKQIFERYANQGLSGRRIHHWLKDELNFRSIHGKHLSLSNVYNILQNHFYYGTLEYPKGSGNFYSGRQEPLISKDLFFATQEQMKRDNAPRQTREFAFTRLMICGLCGSGITAEEKFKQLKDGNVSHYIYYGCTRGKRAICHNKYIREDNLIIGLLKIIDIIDINELGVRHKFQEEIARYNKFRKDILKLTDKPLDQDSIDTRAYAKYILRDGSNDEKRSLLTLLKGRIKVENNSVTIAENL
ncbi:MAG: recombinase [Candidatus Doudnabacteria bacterium]|nr:recombinase [Candidatus Doudnabacteria bacterium]